MFIFSFCFETAPESGVYQILVKDVDDGIWFWLGSNAAFDCCTQSSIKTSENDILLGVRSNGTYSSYVYLDKNVMYPMKIEYINYVLGASLNFNIVTPSGKIMTDFSDTILNFDTKDIANCDEISATNLYSASTIFHDNSATDSTFNVIKTNASNSYAYIPSTLTTRTVQFPTIEARGLTDIPSDTYLYTGSSTITSTLVYATTDSAGHSFTTTDIAVLEPITFTYYGDILGTYTGYMQGTIIDPNGVPITSWYNFYEVPYPNAATPTGPTPSNTYEYAGSSTITSTLVYATTDSAGNSITTTDIAVLMPQILTYYVGITDTETGMMITPFVDSNGVPVETFYYYVQLPNLPPATHTYAYTGSSILTTTLVYPTLDNAAQLFLTTDIAVLDPETTLTTWTGTTTSTVLVTTTAVDVNG
ncbi:MAG: uncharacterized protein K0R07_2218, partial [Sedimentibacter sp.]|nr:uncharacterized protein [Sedimentibacter sp.]